MKLMKLLDTETQAGLCTPTMASQTLLPLFAGTGGEGAVSSINTGKSFPETSEMEFRN